MVSPKVLGLTAGVSGATAVALGAFGAHYLSDRFDDRQMRNWSTGVQYQLIHAVAVLATCQNPRMAKANLAFLGGSALFSGSIYMLCLEYGPKFIWGPATPLGGTTMIGGWALAGLAFL